MKPSLILVAHRAGARFFLHTVGEDRLELLETRSFPKGRLRPNFDAEWPGFSLDAEESRTAEKLAGMLAEKARGAVGTETNFIVVANPRLLAKIRVCLEGQKAVPPVTYVAKDLSGVSSDEIFEHFEEEIRVVENRPRFSSPFRPTRP